MFYQTAILLALAASTAVAHPTTVHRHRRQQQPTAPKKGITFGKTGLAASAQMFQGISWAHNWSPDVNSNPSQAQVPNGIEYVPELQSKHFGTDADPECSTFRNRAQVANAAYLLSVNEPDHVGGGANAMGAGDLATMHAKCFNGLNAKVGTPSVTSDYAPGGSNSLNYLDQWVGACDSIPGGCKYDFLSVHFESYNSIDQDFTWFTGTYMPAVKKWAESHEQVKEVWLTEFRRPDKATEKDFLNKFIPWLEDPAQSWINRYSYYLVEDGTTTEVGGDVAATYSSLN